MNKHEWEAEFDRLFDHAAQSVNTSTDGPRSDMDAMAQASWEQLQIRLRREIRRAAWLKRIMWASVSAASLLAGSLLFHSLQTTEAFRPLFEMVYKVKSGTVSVHSTDKPAASGAKTAPPPPDDELSQPQLKDNRDLPEEGSYRRKKVAVSEAGTETQFVLPIPGDIPDSYSAPFVKLHFSQGESKASAAKFVYKQLKDSSKSFIVLVRKRAYSDHNQMPDGVRTWTPYAEGQGGELEWNQEDVNIIIKGELSEAEQKKVAAGISSVQVTK